MHLLVERMLPAEALLQQGIYLQTCAHIELALWQIVQLADGHDLGAAPDILRYLRLKKNTRDIVKAVRKAVCLIPVAAAVRLASLAERVATGLETRNLVAHGAWFTIPNSDRLHVEHYYTVRTPNGDQWHYVDRTFSRRQIDLAVEDANLILLEAVSIRDALKVRPETRSVSGGGRPRGFASSVAALSVGNS